jgi:hypothetical protein
VIRRIIVALALLALIGNACVGDSNVTDSGKGLPEVTVEFPEQVAPGDIATATFRITNPGPGDMVGLAITFARVGTDTPIVDGGAKNENPAIEAIDPEPLGVDLAAVVYRFPGLEEGESTSISFDLVIPETTGIVANSVTVGAAEDQERLKGLRLETTVE